MMGEAIESSSCPLDRFWNIALIGDVDIKSRDRR